MQHFVILLVMATTIAITGCGNEGPARSPICGRVTVGDQPLKAGRIVFTPIAPNSGPATSAAIVDGIYQISRGEGPIVGSNRVEVEAILDLGFAIDDDVAFAKRGSRPLPRNPIPPDFNQQSKLATEVQPGQDNTYDVAIPPPRYNVSRPQY